MRPGRRRRYLRRLAALAVLALGLAVLVEVLRLPVERFERWPVSAELRDRHGSIVYEAVGPDEQWRRPIPLEEMGPWLPLATIAVEDERFREHAGVDALAVARALAQNAGAGRVVSGASTLTMQLARMADPRPRTLWAKAFEALRALDLERRTTKDELLAHYLNLAPYGSNLRGVAVAARRWFGKEPSELSLPEAALLAGLPQSPERLRPDRFPEAARVRRDNVLDRMLACDFVTPREWLEARAAPVRLARAPRSAAAPHLAWLALARRPYGGRATLDLALQRRVEELAARRAAELPAGAQVALVVADVERSEILALVGSLDAREPVAGQVNGATARRSPGSALKPFVYAAGFEAGRLRPDTLLADRPLDLDGWRPENFEGGFAGEVTVAEALARSLNLPALRAAHRAGLARCLAVLDGCGLDLPADAASRGGLALVTGALEVRLVDLVSAYATLARGGEWRPLRLFPDEPALARPVLSDGTCRAIEGILSTRRRVPAGWDRSREMLDFAWKTGTSAGHRDAWAVGFDARFAIGVWVGRFAGSGDAEFVGARAAEPLLTALFAAARERAPAPVAE